MCARLFAVLSHGHKKSKKLPKKAENRKYSQKVYNLT